MDSQLLKNCLARINELEENKYLTGVFSADHLPRKCNKPIAIIAHSEKASISIGHWVAIYAAKKGPIYFLDSFGRGPQIPTHVNFLRRLGGKIIFNTNCYQSFSEITCGGYCLLFLASKMGYIKNIKKYLSDDKEENDNFIRTSTTALVEHLGL
jgi:hypothetical protein